MSAPEPVTSTWDIAFVVAPDGEQRLTRRVEVTDTHPVPWGGPMIGQFHRSLCEHLAAEDPDGWGQMHPDAIVIVKTEPVAEVPAAS